MKLVTVVGARPQFIKAAVVSHAIHSSQSQIDERIVHTGQHFDANMSDVFFSELGIPAPAHHLGIGGGTHGENTGRMIEAIEATLVEERPDCVLVYGDTDSTLAGALAAVKLHIPVAHVEAGLRSYNRKMPEEVNRVLTDHASSLLFAPTTDAVRHLHEEGIRGSHVQQVGDVMLDAALHFGAVAERQCDILKRIGLLSKQFVLATIHRAENTDDADRLRTIIAALGEIPQPVVMPVHPRTRARLASFGIQLPPSILPIEPVSYLEMITLEKHAQLIATDSGGVQKEAFFHRTPSVTLRHETEWTELIASGWTFLAPPVDVATIRTAIACARGAVGLPIQPYGDGTASAQVARGIQLLGRV